jgi:NAD(P)-dependent dehydrogenase (short-subunit alcohol dehydrogenase family)
MSLTPAPHVRWSTMQSRDSAAWTSWSITPDTDTWGAVEELTDEELRLQLDVNLFGMINMTRAALPQMRRQGSGHLVQMSSLNGVEDLPGAGYYAASKFGVEGFSESLAG